MEAQGLLFCTKKFVERFMLYIYGINNTKLGKECNTTFSVHLLPQFRK